MATATAEFSLVLPDNWLPLDVVGEQRIANEVDALLERGAATDESFHSHRGRIEKQLRAAIRLVRREPVVMAAVLISVLDDILPLFASLTVAIVDSSPSDYQGQPGADVQLVELPSAGVAVRQQFTDTSTDPNTGVTVPAAVFQWLVPMPDQRRRLILTFASPNTEPMLLEAFADLFSAVAESLSFKNTPEPPV
ncbi:MAG: hypothetical protein ABI140_04230 [Jatrophihabitantaceae bacterium]